MRGLKVVITNHDEIKKLINSLRLRYMSRFFTVSIEESKYLYVMDDLYFHGSCSEFYKYFDGKEITQQQLGEICGKLENTCE